MWHLSDGGDLLSTLFSPIAPINPYIIHTSLTRLLTFFPFFVDFGPFSPVTANTTYSLRLRLCTLSLPFPVLTPHHMYSSAFVPQSHHAKFHPDLSLSPPRSPRLLYPLSFSSHRIATHLLPDYCMYSAGNPDVSIVLVLVLYCRLYLCLLLSM